MEELRGMATPPALAEAPTLGSKGAPGPQYDAPCFR